MSVFYDQASLVLVPSGYKSGVVYSQKPMTTDGQLSFTRASTATRVNSSGLIEAVSSGVPRLDYTNSTCPKLLLEPQRTNYQLYSENSAAWTAGADGITVDYNTTETADPFGSNNAEKVTSVSGNRRMYDILSNPAGALTMSAFVKAGTGNEFLMRNTTGSIIVGFNLTSLAITATAGTGTITSYGNGWYRCTASTTSGSASDVFQYQFLNDANEYMYFFGAMVEAGAYATSYIPTTTAAVTRLADAVSKTGISSLIGQTEGAFMIDVNLDTRASFTYFALATNLASAQNYLGIGLNAGSIVFESVVSAVLQAGITLTNSATGRFKIAVAYKANDFVMYVNGTQVGTDTSGSVPTCSQIGFYNYGQTPSVKYNQALVFKTRLTNDQLAQLTAV